MVDELDTQAIGTTGLKRSGGYILEEFLPQLRNRNGARYYSEMVDNCAVIGMSMTIIESLIRQVAWTIKTPKGYEQDTQALFWRDRVEEMLQDMEHTWEHFISEVLSMLVYGFAPFEVVYKVRGGDSGEPTTQSDYDDGLIGLRKIEIRGQETVSRWDFDAEGNLTGFYQTDEYSPNKQGNWQNFIPIERVALFRPKAPKNNPEGRSLLRSAVREYHYLKRIQENEAIGIGKDLTGMVKMLVPREILAVKATPEDRALRAQLEKMIQQLQVDERMGAIFPAELDRQGNPTGFKLERMSAAGSRTINTDAVIRRYELRIASSFLTEFQMLGQDRVGAMNLHDSKSNLFGVALDSVLDNITATINKYVIQRVLKLNAAPRELWPVLHHGKVFTRDLEKVADFVQKLSAAGALSPNPALEQQLLEDADLPVADEEGDIRLDPTEPTPADERDFAMNVLSQTQVASVLQINEHLAAGKIGREAAASLMASSLGMSVEEVQRFLTVPSNLPPEEAP